MYLSQCDPINGCGKTYPTDLQVCPKCGTPSAFSYQALINPLWWAYDWESYPDICTLRATNLATGKKVSFEMSTRRNDGPALFEWLKSLINCGVMIGFNSVSFDYPLTHWFFNNPYADHNAIFAQSQRIFADNRGPGFGASIPEYKEIIPQIDLFKINHYDNGKKMTSLKHIEIFMRMKSVQDLPFEPCKPIGEHNFDALLHYNDHDVEATSWFTVRNLEAIQLRADLTREYSVNMANYSNTKIGMTILVHELERVGVMCYDYEGRKKYPRQSIRSSISLKDVIFPVVAFERPEFNHILNVLKSTTITSTKGALSKINVSEWPQEWLAPKEEFKTSFKIRNGIATNLHVRVEGLTYIFGTGGLHASVLSQSLYSDDYYQIVDVDVTSFYPLLSIINGFYPEHLGVEYCEAYKGIFNKRTTYAKGTPLNAALKEALNASYGNSNNAHTPLYDPLYTMKTTINGQLLLVMLCEQLIKTPNLTMIQCNTDGVTFRVPKIYLDHIRNVCKWWEGLTGLTLEEALYKSMHIRDVNNYIAVYENGKVKRKGSYNYEPQPHQDASSLVVQKAVDALIMDGVDIRHFIETHRDHYDFMIKGKVPRADKLVMRYEDFEVDDPMPNTMRYYISEHGGQLVKISEPKYPVGTWKRKNGVSDYEYDRVYDELMTMFERYDEADVWEKVGDYWLTQDGKTKYYVDASMLIHDERIHTKSKGKYKILETKLKAGWLMSDCSDAGDFDWNNVNFDYYIQEAEKLARPLM